MNSHHLSIPKITPRKPLPLLWIKTAAIALCMLISCSEAVEPFPLWSGKTPGALGDKPTDIPTLTYYPAVNPSTDGPALIIFPGGGYGGLANHEGQGYADFFTKHNIHCFVLKYRLGSSGYRHPIMLQDAARAVRIIRSRASEWNISPSKIGIIGSSAGGHLASTLLTHFDSGIPTSEDPIEKTGCRPDFGILCYSVITMGDNTHQGSKKNLLGDNPSEDLINLLSNEKQVTADTPPCFVWHTVEDQAVKVENSMEFANALRKAKVPFELHLYEKGKHGIGLGKGHPWSNDCLHWLQERGLIPAQTK